MLGLSSPSHDPYFCLLREEVKFGREPRKKMGSGYTFKLYRSCFLADEFGGYRFLFQATYPSYVRVSTWSLEIYRTDVIF